MTSLITLEEHQRWMLMALKAAQMAGQKNEVPIGALLVHEKELVCSTYNQTLTQNNPTAHAEILCLQKAAHIIGNHRLIDSILYVTLEPCMMCLGAMLQARIKQVVYGAYDHRVGCISQHKIHTLPGLNHSLQITPGVYENECAHELKTFFKAKR
jgi:tRNA(adenine34) deaminase